MYSRLPTVSPLQITVYSIMFRKHSTHLLGFAKSIPLPYKYSCSYVRLLGHLMGTLWAFASPIFRRLFVQFGTSAVIFANGYTTGFCVVTVGIQLSRYTCTLAIVYPLPIQRQRRGYRWGDILFARYLPRVTRVLCVSLRTPI